MNPAKRFSSLFDYDDPSSFVNKRRRKRANYFNSLLRQLSPSKPVTILDLGGGVGYWRATGFPDPARYHLTLLNLTPEALPPDVSGVVSVKGDAQRLDFRDREFDIVFSNSVIEHIASPEGRIQMANEVRRVAKRYFVQTPSKWFPLEPHSRIPLFQFFPRYLRALLISRCNVHWFPGKPTFAGCLEVSDSIRLLSLREFRTLFPESTIHKEYLFGMVKSYTAVHGWDKP
jgi:SAM-dependent methyltransferase